MSRTRLWEKAREHSERASPSRAGSLSPRPSQALGAMDIDAEMEQKTMGKRLKSALKALNRALQGHGTGG